MTSRDLTSSCRASSLIRILLISKRFVYSALRPSLRRPALATKAAQTAYLSLLVPGFLFCRRGVECLFFREVSRFRRFLHGIRGFRRQFARTGLLAPGHLRITGLLTTDLFSGGLLSRALFSRDLLRCGLLRYRF